MSLFVSLSLCSLSQGNSKFNGYVLILFTPSKNDSSTYFLLTPKIKMNKQRKVKI